MRYPRVFTRVAMQSPALWVSKSKMIREYALAKKLPLRFFLHTGTIGDAQDDSRKFLRVLQEKGYPVVYRETSESHNWGTWRGSYADIVRWFVSA
jgi:enterochelin esterase-like enzyme